MISFSLSLLPNTHNSSHHNSIIVEQSYFFPFQIITNKTTLFIGICYGGGGGLSSTIATQLNQLMCSRNYGVGQSFQITEGSKERCDY